jgi:conjugal transfer pilus assembly protein TraU
MLRKATLFSILLGVTLFGNEGTFVNPVTDVCWECLLPITVSGVNVTPGKIDQVNHSDLVCVCSGVPPKAGIPITFWEPSNVVEVTRHAYKLIGLGGVSIGKESIKNRGTVGSIDGGPSRASFYHVHFYRWPLLTFLGILTDFSCITGGDLEIDYMSELDPLWNDEQLSLVLNGEAGFFANPAAQVACVADCTAASINKPTDSLYWCAGCLGSLYPFTGYVAHHVGPTQASGLLVNRILAKLHRSYQLKGFKDGDYCEAKYMPVIKKSGYKMQLVYPIPQTSGQCHALGRSDMIWGSGKSFPNGGEDFIYVVWTKKQCCLDAVKNTAFSQLP